MQGEDDGLVADTDYHGVEDFARRGLLGCGLDLVLLGEGRRNGIEQDEEDAWNPPEDDLNKKGADKIDGIGVVGRDYVPPISCRRIHDSHGVLN